MARRPEILYPLFANITSLPGVGQRLGRLFERLCGPHVLDVLWHLPSGRVDRCFMPRIAEAPDGAVVTLELDVLSLHPPEAPRRPWRVLCSDDSGFLTLVYFHAKRDWLERLLPPGTRRVVSGRIDHFRDERQMTHPDHVGPPEELDKITGVEPVYPLTTGLSNRQVRRAVEAALERAPELAEWLDPALRDQQGWAPWRDALETAHTPRDGPDLEPSAPARARLAYDELLSEQLALNLVRQAMRRRPGRMLNGDGTLTGAVRTALPFTLTDGQESALAEIMRDMADPHRMLRLLQGDVGSGKTVVALMAMLTAVESGAQAALMAPTEVLARQHHATIAPLALAAGVETVLLTGRDKGRDRARVLERLADGRVPLAVGTHALFQEEIAFHDLGLAVIDEQHRFGVHQRLSLDSKGRGTDLLVMTATPIPRTLALASYGDMDISSLREKPAGRQPVDTRTLPADRLEDVVGAVGRAVKQGAQVFWVCPLVEETEESDLAAADARHAFLRERFGDRVGLVHGRMKGAEKEEAMRAFAEGETLVLVATTVIEVGVDVPAATVMVVEHAERFGLAQLHQLRGRIGRGGDKATCLLLYTPPLGDTAKARLNALRETEDGFRLAEEDLRLRGAGEVLGTRQSGLPDYRLADLTAHADLIAMASDDARLVLNRDPDLEGERGQALRTLLYLFQRDAAVRYLRSG